MSVLHNDQAATGQTAQPPAICAWDYLRLRREAAGLTIAQAAAFFYKRPEHRADVEATLRKHESAPHILSEFTDCTICRAFPFDHLIYRQLAFEPPEQHPRLCRTCGWDEWTEANDQQGNSVTWADAGDVCTRCEQRQLGKRGAQAALPLDRAA